MTEKKNKDFMRLLDLRVKPEDDRGGESGRSMVEMLGVLAIVGVLSVGGIAGYTYAMNRHYANELIMGASERMVLVTAQQAAGLRMSLREFDGIKTAGGTFGDVFETTGGFAIPVSGVKGAVCEILVKATDGTEVSIAKNDESLSEVSCDDDNPNDLAFVFKFGIEPSETDEKLWEPSLCEDDTECTGECEVCMEGECIKTLIGTCRCSDNEMEVDFDWDGIKDDCIPCTYAFAMWNISSNECERKCPNREMDENDELCVLKECPDGYIRDPYAGCYSCDSLYGISDVEKTECERKCPNREMDENDEYCVLKECPEGYIRDTYSDCYSCNDLSDIYVEEEDECEIKCPNRRMSDYGSCNLVECPDEYLFDAEGQVCRSCDDSSSYLVEDPNECTKCPNRELKDGNICGIKNV